MFLIILYFLNILHICSLGCFLIDGVNSSFWISRADLVVFENKVLLFWRVSPSIEAHGLQKKYFVWKVSSSLGAFGAHGHVHVQTCGPISHASGPQLAF